MLRAQSNPTHYTLAALLHTRHLTKIITQNVDGLHHKASSLDVESNDQRILQLHGSLHVRHFFFALCPRDRLSSNISKYIVESAIWCHDHCFKDNCRWQIPDGGRWLTNSNAQELNRELIQTETYAYSFYCPFLPDRLKREARSICKGHNSMIS